MRADLLMKSRGEVCFDGGKKLAGTIRLRNVGIAAGGARLFLVSAQRIRRHHDDRYVLQGGTALDATSRLVSVEHGKLNVHQNQVRTAFRNGGKGFLSVHGFVEVEPGAAEEV